MTIAKIQLKGKVASRSYSTNGRAASTLGSDATGFDATGFDATGFKVSIGIGRRSAEPASNLQRQRFTNPARFRGRWAGVLTQPGRTWNFEMNLKRTGSVRFVGTSVITDLGDSSIFGVMSLRGRVVNGALLFKETLITDQNPPPGSRWCIKGGRLQIATVNGRTFLRGPWSDPTCNAGQIRLKR